jgi:hypothetical protein
MVKDIPFWGQNVRPSIESIIRRLVKVEARVVYHARRWYVHVASAFSTHPELPYFIRLSLPPSGKRVHQLVGRRCVLVSEKAKTGLICLSIASSIWESYSFEGLVCDLTKSCR